MRVKPIGSFLWSVGSAVARNLGGRGDRSVRLDSRVISVGNLQAGGAGKTPLVALLANQALERGLRVCVLTRGYRGRWESVGGVIAPGDPLCDARESGDEAALLQELCPGAWIGVGADRVAAYSRVRERVGVSGSDVKFDLVILDDGFQHHRIRKDLEIVALTSRSRSEFWFRDFPSALDHADLVVWTKGNTRPEVGDRPLVRVEFRLKRPEAVAPVWLVTGVADGDEVLRRVREAGYEVRRHLGFGDHSEYSSEKVEEILQGATSAGCGVVVTGKDWVKWRHFVVQDRVTVLEPEVVFREGGALWNQVIWAGAWIYFRLPRGAQIFLGNRLGDAICFFGYRRTIALSNLERAGLESGLLRSTYRSLGNLILEMFLVLGGHLRPFVTRTVDVVGMEFLKSACQQGRGVIFLANHVGNWEVMAATGGVIAGIDLMMVTKRLKPDWLHRAVERGRTLAGVRATYEPRTLKDILYHLKQGKVIGFVLDQYAGPPVGVRVPLFGVPVGTSLALAAIVKRTNAIVLPVENFRKSDGRWEVRVFPPLAGAPGAESGPTDLARFTARAVGWVESSVRAHPEQWLWIHRRFKGDLGPVRDGEWESGRAR
jgi:tetraacyldisaccharide 4'-kinase